jgi:hypothetical protein
LLARLSLGVFAGEEGGGVGVPVGFVDREVVKGAVGLSVAAAVEAMVVGVAEEAGIGAAPPVRASLASVANRSAPAISPIGLAAVSGPHPRSASSCGA